jgi:hemerythrin-like domain-containing protein
MTLPERESLSANVTAASTANDPTAYLLAEHEWTRVVLDDLHGRLGAGGPGLSMDDAEALKHFVDLHIRREEEVFFPALEPIVRAMGLGSTEDMYGEHDAIRIRLEELEDAIARSHLNEDHLAALRRSLLVHFDNEEELLFYEPASRLSEELRQNVIEGFKQIT